MTSAPPPAPLAWTAPDGTAYHVWDVRDGRRVAAGEGPAEQRLFVRVSDRCGFEASLHPRAPAYPTDGSLMQYCLDRALDAGPLRRAHEDDAAYATRCASHLTARRAAARAELERTWAAVPRCAGPCPTCDAQDAAPRPHGGAAALPPD
jgi:hypothetical protein